FCSSLRSVPTSSLFPYTTLFRSSCPCYDNTDPSPRGFLVEIPDALPVLSFVLAHGTESAKRQNPDGILRFFSLKSYDFRPHSDRSEEHTSELQSRFDLVCRLLLE